MFSILEKEFAYSRLLADDIIKYSLQSNFRTYIYSFIEEKIEEEPIVEENPDEDMVYVDIEALRDNVRIAVTDGLNDSLNKYKEELLNNPEANLGDFLTVENLQAYCGPVYKFELIDGTTLKAVINLGSVEYIYYALMNIDGTNLVVTEVEVLTETEYNNR